MGALPFPFRVKARSQFPDSDGHGHLAQNSSFACKLPVRPISPMPVSPASGWNRKMIPEGGEEENEEYGLSENQDG
jgi:hypothetical protein